MIAHVLIDSQKALDIEVVQLKDGDGDVVTYAPFTSAHEVFSEWKQLDLAHRDFRYASDESDTDPSTVILMWVGAATGALNVSDVDPFWDGSSEFNGWTLESLAFALPEGMLTWELA